MTVSLPTAHPVLLSRRMPAIPRNHPEEWREDALLLNFLHAQGVRVAEELLGCENDPVIARSNDCHIETCLALRMYNALLVPEGYWFGYTETSDMWECQQQQPEENGETLNEWKARKKKEYQAYGVQAFWD